MKSIKLVSSLKALHPYNVFGRRLCVASQRQITRALVAGRRNAPDTYNKYLMLYNGIILKPGNLRKRQGITATMSAKLE